MAGTVWLFLDEFGDANFGRNGSRYFGIASVATDDPVALSHAVDSLRHVWWSEEHVQRGYFHAHADCWPVRQAVFDLFPSLPIVRTDVLAISKRGTYLANRDPRALYSHALRLLLDRACRGLHGYDLLVVAAAEWPPALGNVRTLARNVLTGPDAADTVIWRGDAVTLQAPSASHGGLQMADYTGWAAHRARMRNEGRWVVPLRRGWSWSDAIISTD